jgi:RNA polymerase sigma-70 factor (ECF subfamily)
MPDKRGGHHAKVQLDDALHLAHTDSSRLVELDLALSRLADKDQRLARVFELRFFTGLTVDEAAAVIQVAPRTINRDSRMARAWLQRELAGGEP